MGAFKTAAFVVVTLIPWIAVYHHAVEQPLERAAELQRALGGCLALGRDIVLSDCDRFGHAHPTWLPWVNERNSEANLLGEGLAAARAVRTAAGRGDPVALAEEGARLIATARALPEHILLWSAFRTLADAGASHLIMANLEVAPRAAMWELGWGAALTLGDLDGARRVVDLAVAAPPDAISERLVLDVTGISRRAAASCLLGRGEHAKATMERLTAELEGHQHHAETPRVIYLACGGEDASIHAYGLATGEVNWALSHMLEAPAHPARLDIRAGANTHRDDRSVARNLDRLTVLALVLDAGPLDVADIFASRHPRWEASSASVPDPSRLARLADRLHEMASDVEGVAVDRAYTWLTDAPHDPATELHALSSTAELTAVSAWRAFGRADMLVDRYERVKDRILKSPAPAKGLVAELARGLRESEQPERARALVAAVRSSPSWQDKTRQERFEILYQGSLALAALGRLDEALTVGIESHHAAMAHREGLLKTLANASKNDDLEFRLARERLELSTRALSRENRAPALDHDTDAASWLILALSHRLGRSAPDLPLSEAPKRWFARATQDTTRDGPDDPLAWLAETPRPEVLVLGPALYLMAASAPGDPEVWLDGVFVPGRHVPLTQFQYARAEAAAWRGDEDTAQSWRARRASVLSLVKDYRTQVLAHHAGL